MFYQKHGKDLALWLLRRLPRVALNNIRDNPGSKKRVKRGRGQHGGNKHGAGNKGSGQRQNFMRLGYETGNIPFYLRFGREPYYNGHHLRREYPPLSLQTLQKYIDTNRVDTSKPIDLVSLINTGLFDFKIDWNHAGVNLTDEVLDVVLYNLVTHARERVYYGSFFYILSGDIVRLTVKLNAGADLFTAKINIEVQWTTEPVIAAIERNGGIITTAYYDPHCLHVFNNVTQFFTRGVPIPRRMLPPNNCLDYYSSAGNRGYLADPEKISRERLVLAQKYGYEIPKIENDPNFNMLMQRKDPRQLFYGLEPGWVVSLVDKAILKPKAEYLKEFYTS